MPRMGIAILLAVIAGLAPATGAAQQAEVPARPRIGLVLGGGGARGAAHIGVIRVLEQLHVPVDYVVGTSMGSIIGGLYAAGYDADEMERILASIDWNETLRDTPRRSEQPMRRKEEDLQLAVRYRLGLRRSGPITPPGAIEGQHLQMLLRRVLRPVQKIEDFDLLPLPFRAVATDLSSGETVILGRGDLAMAIRSSMSVPGAFSPVHIDGRVYIDGGVVDNVPIDVARALGADVVIAVDVSGDLSEMGADASALGVSLQASQILVRNRTLSILETLRPEDVYLRVDLGTMSGADFGHSVETIPQGERAARDGADELRRYAVSADDYARWRSEHSLPEYRPPIVTDVRVDPTGAPSAAALVAARVYQAEGDTLDLHQLEHDIDRIYAIGRFSLVDYSLEPEEEGEALVLRPRDKTWGPTLARFGMGVSDDFQGGEEYRITIETLTHGLDSRGREWRNRIDVGSPTAIRTELYQPLDLRARWFLAAYGTVRQSDYTFTLFDQSIANYELVTVESGLSIGRNIGQSNEIRAGLRYGHVWLKRRVGLESLFPNDDATRGQWTAGLAHDTLNDFTLPSSGNRTVVESVWTRKELGAGSNNLLVAGQANQAVHFGKHCFLLGVAGGGIASGESSDTETFFLGGPFRLSGYKTDELLGSRYALARVVYYNNRGLENVALVGTPLYFGFSAEAGNTWLDWDVPDLTDLRYAGSVFAGLDTIVGPVYLGYGKAERGRHALFFSLGPLFGLGRERLFADP